MAQPRSRKKRRPDPARAARAEARREAAERTSAMTLVAEEPPAGEGPASDADALRRGYARGRARDEAIRAGLEPLAPGERPGAVTVAAVVALLIAIANVIAALTIDISDAGGDGDPTGPTILITGVLVLAAIGMWRAKYWAVLGFQVILGLQLVIYSIAITRVEKAWLGALLVVLVVGLGYLFWKLVRAMARLQMPTGPSPRFPAD